MARECAYQGAEIMIRTAGYTAPIRESWRFTNQAICVSEPDGPRRTSCMCGLRRLVRFHGRRMIVNFDGSTSPTAQPAAPTRSLPEVRPDLVREARINWGVENNIYQLWHRGYVAVKGGAMDCPYTFQPGHGGRHVSVPWEDQVKVTDGNSCGFPAQRGCSD